MAEGYDKPKNLEYTNPFEAWNKYMPNNIVDKFGQSKPSEVLESDDYHWREANYYGVQTKLNPDDGLWHFNSVTGVEPGKYLILKKKNHPTYNETITTELQNGAKIIEEDGYEYAIYEDEINPNKKDVYEQEIERKENEDFFNQAITDSNIQLETNVENFEFAKDSEQAIPKDEDGRPLLKRINHEARYFMNNAVKKLKNHFVGNSNDFARINAEMLGTSNLNLAVQLLTQNLPGGNWELEGAASLEQSLSSAGRDDYTIYEKIAEQILGIIYDSPTIAAATATTLAIPLIGSSPALLGFNIGFVNSSIKEALIVSLQNGDVDTPEEFWDVYIKHGLASGFEAGMHLGLALQLGSFFPGGSFLKELAVQTAAFEIASRIFGEEFSVEKTIVTAGTIAPLIGTARFAATGRVFGNVVRDHRLLSQEGFYIKEQLKDKNINDIVKKAEKDKTIIEDLSAVEGTAVPFRSYKDPKKVQRDIEIQFESYKNPEKLRRESQKLQEKLDRIGSQTTVVENFKFEKLTKEQKKQRLTEELNKLKENPEYIPVEYAYEKQFLLGAEKSELIQFNKQLQKEIQSMLLKDYVTLGEKVAKGVDSFHKLIDKAVEKFQNQKIFDFKKDFGGLDSKVIDYAEIGKGNPKPKIDSKASVFENLMVNWYDKLFPFHKINNQILRARVQKDKNGNWLKTLFSKEEVFNNTLTGAKEMQLAQSTSPGISWSWISTHQLDFKFKVVGKSYQEITKNIKSADDIKAVDEYLYARRALEEYANNPKVEDGRFIFTKAEAKDIVQKGVAKKYDKLATELYKYQDNLLQYMFDAGLLDKNTLAYMREANKSYVPWYQVVEFNAGAVSKVKARDYKNSDPFKEQLRREDIKVKSPLKSIYNNTFHFIKLANQNAGFARFIKEVEAFRKDFNLPNYIPELKKVERKLAKENIQKGKSAEDLISEKLVEEMYTKKASNIELLFESQATKKLKPNEHLVYKNGVPEIYTMPEYLSNSLKTNNVTSNMMMALLFEGPYGALTRTTAKTLRAGVTFDPAFLYRNFVKDMQMTTLNSRNNAGLFYQSILGLATMMGITRNPRRLRYFKEWSETGGPVTLVGLDRTYLAKTGGKGAETVLEVIQSRPKQNQPIRGEESSLIMQNVEVIKNRYLSKKIFVDQLTKIQNFFEGPARLGEYIFTREKFLKLRQKGVRTTLKEQKQLALFESKDLIDFTKAGIKGEIVNQHSAFFNAGLQGTAKLFENFTGPGKGFTPKQAGKFAAYIVGTQILPSALLWIENHDDPVYQAKPQWIKDLYWLYPIKDENGNTVAHIPVPKPWEVGLIFSTGTERFLDFMNDKDRQSITDWIGSVVGTYAVNTANTLFGFTGKLIQAGTNKDWRTGGPLIRNRTDGLHPDAAYDVSASPWARGLANLGQKIRPIDRKEVLTFYGKMQDIVGDTLNDAARYDFIFNAAFGTGHKYLAGISNEIIRQENLTPGVPGPEFQNYWEAFKNSRFVEAFYITNTYIDDKGDLQAKISKSAEPITKMWDEFRKVYRPHIMEGSKIKNKFGEDSAEYIEWENNPLTEEAQIAGSEISVVYQYLKEYNIILNSVDNENPTEGRESYSKIHKHQFLQETIYDIYEAALDYHSAIAEHLGKESKYKPIQIRRDGLFNEAIDEFINK